MKTVLLVEDNLDFREAVETSLSLEGFRPIVAENGRVALDLLKSNSIDIVLTDVQMPEMDGVELLKAIRSQGSLPVVLMTGISNIMETAEAHRLGANDFIPKPFERAELVSVLNRALAGPARSELSAQADSEGRFCKLGINDFVTGRTIKFNIFIKLSESKFVKIAHQGDDVSVAKIQFYREKGIHFLYLREDDFRQYVGFSLNLSKTASEKTVVDPTKRLNLLRHTGEVLSQQIETDGISPEMVDSATAFVETSLSLLTSSTTATEVLDALRLHADHVYIHSVGVSLYSVLIAQAVEWNLPSNKFKLAIGGLIHDVGLKEVDRKILETPRFHWSREDVRVYETHPMRGHAILQDIQGLPEDVRDIIKQHHENCISRGYPHGLKKASIHPMAKLISVADEFCYRILRGPQFTQMTPVEALQDLYSNQSDFLDRGFMDSLKRIFELKA